MTALKEWEKGGHSDFDLVVVADLLPMLSLREFVEAAQDFQPHAEVVVTGEVTTAPELLLEGYSFCPKPLCIQDLVNFVRGKRRNLIQAAIFVLCAGWPVGQPDAVRLERAIPCRLRPAKQ